MNKVNLQTTDMVDENIKRIGELFPNCLTEIKDENGRPQVAIDFDQLRQELSKDIVEGPVERYQFTWPDKRNSIRLANAPTTDTLRPVRNDETTPTGADSEGNPYCSTGSVNFDTTENLYIEGDNLQVLKLLREDYLGKIKMIYIDPPYNTGNDFVYDDDFSQSSDAYIHNSGQTDANGNRLVTNTESNGRFHTDWLNMIYPRLKLAKDLLSEDGILFISIDDNELDNLIKVGNEIYGATNHIATLSVENNPKGRKNSAFVSVSSEYCVIFARNKEMSYFIENVPKKASDMTLDENGRYVHNSGKRVLVGENSFNKKVSNPNSEKNYVVYYRCTDKALEIKKENAGNADKELINNGFIRYASEKKGVLIENTYTEEKFKELFQQDALDFSSDKIYEKNYSDTIRIKSQLINREYEAIVRGKKQIFSMELTTTGGGTILKNLFTLSDSPFPAPKNVGFLKLLISLFPSAPFLVLDFFSGSATTAHAVMQLNAEDGGKRKFIMVQLPEKTDEKSEAYKAGYKNICEIGKERIRRAGKKIKEEHPEAKDLDIGFRVLKLDTSNMEDVQRTPKQYTQASLFADNLKPGRSEEDLLFQTMLRLGIDLSAKIESFNSHGKTVFNVNDNYLLACFDTDVNESAIEEIAKRQPVYFVMRDASLASDNVRDNIDQLWKHYNPGREKDLIII